MPIHSGVIEVVGLHTGSVGTLITVYVGPGCVYTGSADKHVDAPACIHT